MNLGPVDAFCADLRRVFEARRDALMSQRAVCRSLYLSGRLDMLNAVLRDLETLRRRRVPAEVTP